MERLPGGRRGSRFLGKSKKGKGQSDISDWPLFNAGNDLRSHTLGACSTIGPAGLNFRVRDGNGWIPRGKITDKSKLSALSHQLSACCRGGRFVLMDSKLVSAHSCRLPW
jgi:hypothetical protein